MNGFAPIPVGIVLNIEGDTKEVIDWINPTHVMAVRDRGKGCTLFMAKGEPIASSLSAKEVVQLFRNQCQ